MNKPLDSPFWSQPPDKADIVIIGGGLVGVGLASHLALAGVDCVLFEKNTLASGASGRNDGQIIQDTVDFYPRMKTQYGDRLARDFLRFKTDGQEDLHGFLMDHRVPEHVAYNRAGSLNLAINDAERKQLDDAITVLRKDGFPVEQLGTDEIEEKIGTRFFKMAKYNAMDATVNPRALTVWLGAFARNQGVNIIENCPVMEMHDGVVVHPYGSTRCEMVLLATNAYTPQLLPWFKGKIFPVRGQVMATDPTPNRYPPIGCITDFGYEYWHWTPDGRLIIGGKRQDDEDVERGYREWNNPKVQSALREFMIEMYPSLEDVRIASQWSGTMGFSVDGLPLVGPVAGDQTLWSVSGFTGYGLGLFWPVTKAVSEAIMGEKNSRTEFLKSLSPSRLGG